MGRRATILLIPLILAGCSKTTPPAPGVTSSSPSVVARSDRIELRIEGHGFVPKGASTNDVLVELTMVRGIDGTPGHGEAWVVGGTATAPSQGTEQATISVDTSTMAPGVYDLTLSVAQHQSYAFSEALLVLPAPTWGSLQRRIICTTDPSGTDIILAGSDIPVVDGRSPALSITGVHKVVTPTTGEGCRTVAFRRAAVSLCSGLRAPLPPPSEGAWIAVDLDSPYPGDPAAGWPRRFDVQSAPALQPPPRPYSVVDGPAWVSIQGGLVFEPTQPPQVTVDGLPVELLSTCSPGDVVSCFSTDFWLPQSTASGAHQVQVDYRNGCASSVSIQVAPQPMVTGWSPALSCGSGPLRLFGTGFVGPVHVLYGGFMLQASCVSAGANPCREILIQDPPLARGEAPLVVESSTEPRSYSTPVNVPAWSPPWSGPLAPRLVAAGNVHRLTLPDLGGLTGGVTDVTVAPVVPSEGVPPVGQLPFEYDGTGITFTIPGTLPPGEYTVLVSDEGPCPMVVPGLVIAPSKILRIVDFEGWTSVYWVYSSRGGTEGLAMAPGGGNPGGALVFSAAGGPVPDLLYMDLTPYHLEAADLGEIRLDLRYEGAGEPIPLPPLVITGVGITLEHDLPPSLAASWSTATVSLADPAGWTARDQAGSWAATAADLDALRAAMVWSLSFPGAWTDGPSTLWIDNIEFVLR